MSTSKQVAANQANAQRSTGPKSLEARAAVRNNAIKHGLTSKQLIIPGEDPEAFHSLASDLTESYHPANAQEQILVIQIAESLWRLLRARGIETATFQLHMLSTTPPSGVQTGMRLRTPANEAEAAARAFDDHAHTFDKLRRYEAAIERAYYRAIDHLLKLQKLRLTTETKQIVNSEIGIVSQKASEPKSFTANAAPEPTPQHPDHLPAAETVSNMDQTFKTEEDGKLPD